MNKIPNKLDFIAPIIALIIFLGLWESIVIWLEISPLILPSPSQVFSVFISNFVYLIKHGGITLYESVLGFLLGGFVAFLLAVAFQFSKYVEKAVYPYAIALKAIPLIALAPLVTVWFGTGMASKVVLASVIAFFPILVNLIQGFKSVDREAIELMSTFSATRWQIFWKVRMPYCLPYLFSGMKISASFAVVGAVVAEFTGAKEGIGFVIKSSSYYLNTDMTFAAILVAAFCSLSFFGLITLLERKIYFWEQHA